jgi:DNA-binding MarR family transcriptional regulator
MMTTELKNSHFLVLRSVYRANFGVTSSQIAKQTGFALRTCTDALKILRDQGLINRRRHINDVTVWYQYITDEGRTVYIREAIERGELGCQ